MGFSIDGLVNSIYKNKIFSSPIYLAIIIVIIIIIVNYFVYYSELDEESSFIELTVRSTVYAIIPISILIFTYHNKLLNDFDHTNETNKIENIVDKTREIYAGNEEFGPVIELA